MIPKKLKRLREDFMFFRSMTPDFDKQSIVEQIILKFESNSDVKLRAFKPDYSEIFSLNSNSTFSMYVNEDDSLTFLHPSKRRTIKAINVQEAVKFPNSTEMTQRVYQKVRGNSLVIGNLPELEQHQPTFSLVVNYSGKDEISLFCQETFFRQDQEPLQMKHLVGPNEALFKSEDIKPKKGKEGPSRCVIL